MIFKQFRFEKIGQASYLFGCARSKEAAVVDPTADLGPEFYLMEAADRGLAIVEVLETHVHADYLSCGRELAEAAGAEHALLATAPVRYPFTPLHAEQTIDLGKVRVAVLPTPGHTPEHAAYLVTSVLQGAVDHGPALWHR